MALTVVDTATPAEKHIRSLRPTCARPDKLWRPICGARGGDIKKSNFSLAFPILADQ